MNITTNFGSIIDRENWEAYIEDPFSQIVSLAPENRTSLNRKNHVTERGFVIRDKIIKQRIFLSAIGALEILRDMREVETWKRNGMVIGTPALTSAQDEQAVDEEILRTPFMRQHPEYVLFRPLKLTPEQSKDLFDFLLENEQLLTELAEKDEIVTRPQLTELFKNLAEYGRRKRLNKSG